MVKEPVKTLRRSEKEIRLLLERQQLNNLSVSAFCKANKIHKATFYNWRSKYGMEITNPKFIPVQLRDEIPGAPFAEITFSSNIVVKIYQPVDASWFKPFQQL